MSATVLILAHAGHWLAGLLYLAPVVIVVGALVLQSYKDRRNGGLDGDDEGDGAPAADIDVREPPMRG